MRSKSRSVSFEACILMMTLGCASLPEDARARDGNTTAPQSQLPLAPALDAPTVGSEFDLGQPLDEAKAVIEAGQAVATNDEGVSLVVWSVGSQSWISMIGIGWYSLGTDIYAARVGPTGEILDPAGIPIATTDFSEATPAVASDGSGWIVTWAGRRYDNATGIFAARVTSAGDVQNSTVVTEPTTDYTLRQPAVAYDGTNFLLLWQRGLDIYVARMGADGTVLDPNGTFVGTVAAVTGYPEGGTALAFDGTNWLVVWTQVSFDVSQRAYTWYLSDARVNAAGNVIDPGSAVTFAPGRNIAFGRPTLSCHASSCLTAWQEFVVDGTSSSKYVAGTSIGNTLNQKFTVSGGEEVPGVAWAGDNWLVASVLRAPGGHTTVQATRVSPTGVVIDPTPVTVATGAEQLAAAPSSSGALITWGGSVIEQASGTLAGFIVDGDPTGSFVVSRNYLRSPGQYPSASTSKTNWLLVWQHSEGSQPANGSIRGTRVSPTGAILDTDGIAVSGTSTNQTQPQLASDGTNWLVAWMESRSDRWDVYAARVAGDGQVLDPEPKLVAGGGDNHSLRGVAFDGAKWLVTWSVNGTGATFAARVAADGTVLDPEGIPLGGSMEVFNAGLAGGDAQWLLAGDMFDRANWVSGIFGQRIADDGTLLDTEPFAIPSLASNLLVEDVAYGAETWLVVGVDIDAGRLYGARVASSGAVLDSEPILLSTSGGVDRNPAVSYDGTNWLVGWTDRSMWPEQYRQNGVPADVYGTLVSVAGEVLEPDGFRVAAGKADQILEAVAGGRGRWLTIYSTAGGPDEGLRARIVQNACTPLGSTDATCDGVDDDCDGTPDEDFTPTPTTCGTGACAAVGTTSCVDGEAQDTCAPDLTNDDGDGVPNCRDACPLVPGTGDDGCPVPGAGGEGGQGGQGGEESSGGNGAVAGNHDAGGGGAHSHAGASGAHSHAGMSNTAGHAGTVENAGEAGEAGGGAVPSGGNGQGGSAAGRGGEAGLAGDASGYAGANTNPPPPKDQGCGCSVPAERSSAPWGLGLGLIGGSIARRRRRRGQPS